LSAETEQTVIQRAITGDLEAFNQLVLAYQQLAYSVAFRTLQDSEAAADAVQDSFIKAYRAIGGFQGGSFKSWIIRIVVNTCYDLLRSKQQRLTDSLDDWADDDEQSVQVRDPSETPDVAVERQELHQVIERAIAGLPPEQRLVLTLCDVHGYAYEEISTMTGLPMGTVKSRINRARTKVRDTLLQTPELLPNSFRPKGGTA
jgi:RNA polymerase sigma-70 factor (ECF subfamily)